MLTFAVIISAILQLAIAGYVLKKGKGNASYLLFVWLTVSGLCWDVLNYFSITAGDSAYITYIVRGIMVFSVSNTALFYVFAHTFPQKRLARPLAELRPFIAVTLLVAIMSASPYLFRTMNIQDGQPNISIGPGITAFTLYILVTIFAAFRVLLNKQRVASGLKRNQIRILLIAASVYWIVIPVTNFIVTLTFNTLFFVAVSPFYTLLFSAIIAYALLKHRLFDSATKLQASTLYVDYYLKNPEDRAAEYYQLQTTVYQSGASHVSLDFSGVDDLKKADIRLLKYLKSHMASQGKKIYFTGYSKKVFKQLRAAE